MRRVNLSNRRSGAGAFIRSNVKPLGRVLASGTSLALVLFVRQDGHTVLYNLNKERCEPEMTRDKYGQAYQTGFDRTIRFLISQGLSGDYARDIAQAAWVRGWERLNQLRNEPMVFTWVNTIALNFYRRAIRSERALQ